MRNELKGCVSVRSTEPSRGQALREMVANDMEGVEARRFCQATRKTGLMEYHYRKVFRGDDVLQCSAFEKLEVTTREMLKWKTVSKKEKWYQVE